ncbi:MAG: hypothetical protein IAC23_02415, partial [Bacteroidetes bacterium]|nr:hypothetical protein [Candidatus Cryptobacteroides merdavium]
MEKNRIIACIAMLPLMAAFSLPAFSQSVYGTEEAGPVFPERDSTGAYIVPEGYALKDSIIYVPAPAADTLLAGKNIFMELPSRTKGDAADV